MRWALLSAWVVGCLSVTAPAATRPTDSTTALAIDGPGWFLVRDAVSNERYVTRCGDFAVDEFGRFQNREGHLLQGFVDAGLRTVGDLRIESGISIPGAPIVAFEFRPDSTLRVQRADGTEFTGGQVLLQNFREPEKLTRVGLCLYVALDQAEPLPTPMPPGGPGLGSLKTGLVELEEVRWSLLPEARRDGPLVIGALTFTGIPTDLGIRGEGFFILRDTNSSALFATRAGLFLRDGDGYLINYTGLRVQGWSDAALTTLGDIRIDGQGRPATADPNAALVSFSIDPNGFVSVTLSDGTQFTRGQVLLQSFQAPGRLVRTNHGLFAGVIEAGPFPSRTQPRDRVGRIHQGALELINVTPDLLALRSRLQFFLQGRIRGTGVATDLALSGAGFFIVRNPANGELLATRRGRFRLDENVYMVTTEGWRLQGYDNPELTTQGDLRIDARCAPTISASGPAMVSFAIEASGKLVIHLTDGRQCVRAQVLLQRFDQPYLLRPAGHGAYTNLSAGRPLPGMAPPGSHGLSRIRSGALEIPNRIGRLILPQRRGTRLLITGEPGSRCAIQAWSHRRWRTLGRVRLGPNGEAEFVDLRARRPVPPTYRVVVE